MTENTFEEIDYNYSCYNHYIFTISIQKQFFEFFSTTSYEDKQSLFGWLYPKNATHLTIQYIWLISKLSKIKNIRNIIKKINNYCLPIVSPQYLELIYKSENDLQYAFINNQKYPLIHKQNIYKNQFDFFEIQQTKFINDLINQYKPCVFLSELNNQMILFQTYTETFQLIPFKESNNNYQLIQSYNDEEKKCRCYETVAKYRILQIIDQYKTIDYGLVENVKLRYSCINCTMNQEFKNWEILEKTNHYQLEFIIHPYLHDSQTINKSGTIFIKKN